MHMRGNWTPSLAPTGHDQTVYIVLSDFGPLGREHYGQRSHEPRQKAGHIAENQIFAILPYGLGALQPYATNISSPREVALLTLLLVLSRCRRGHFSFAAKPPYSVAQISSS
jgi:hypothetical protein